MQHIEPQFNYPHQTPPPRSGDATIEHQNKNAKKPKIVKKTKKYGSSLGWGWFQVFSLFVTALLLITTATLIWLMIGHETIHEGPPKYVIVNDGNAGTIGYNPQLNLAALQYTPQNITPQDTKPLDALEPISLISQSEEETTVAPTAQKSQSQEIEELLGLGKKSLDTLKLSTPENDSAVYYYTQVLQIEPKNQAALTGLNNVVARYITLAERNIQRGDLTQAHHYIQIALQLAPNNPNLHRLQSDIEQLRQSNNQTN